MNLKLSSLNKAGVSLVLGVLAFPAMANAPASHWTVGPIAAKASSGAGYCSMKNTYQEGQELVFARDQNGGNSVAIDFHKKELTVGGQYKVSVGTEAVQREMTAIAATDQVMIVNMGRDQAFYQALREGREMILTWNGKTLSFDLTGTSDGLSALEECADALGNGKKTFAEVVTAPVIQKKIEKKKVVKAPVPAPAAKKAIRQEEQKADAQETQKLKEEVVRLQSEKEKLQWAEKDSRTLTSRLTAEVERLRKEINQISQDKQKDAGKTAASEEELGRLKSMLAEQTEMQQKLRNELTAREQEQKRLSAELSMSEQEQKKLQQDLQNKEQAPPQVVIVPQAQTPVVTPEVPKLPPQGYSWMSDDIYGSLEERAVPDEQDFAEAVQGYMQEAKSRCSGDFAFQLDPVNVQYNVQTGEMACIDGQNDAAAALLFALEGHKLKIMIHEGSTDQVDTVIAKRDAIVMDLYK